MNQSQNFKNYAKSSALDNSKAIDFKQENKKVMVQNWINKIHNENKVEEKEYIYNMVESWKLENLQNNVNNLKFPSLEIINSMTLEQTLAYEAMLVNIVDTVSSDLNTNVNILLHLKIISNNQMYKFKIFE